MLYCNPACISRCFLDIGPQTYWGTTLTFQGHVVSSIRHITFPVGPLEVEPSLYLQTFSRYSVPKSRAHRQTDTPKGEISIVYPMQCIAPGRQW